MTDQKRRDFIRMAGATAAIPLTAVVASRLAYAADLVDPTSPAAVNLKYIAMSEIPDQMCKGCALYQGGDAAQGACPLFQGSDVTAEGWCTAWVKKS